MNGSPMLHMLVPADFILASLSNVSITMTNSGIVFVVSRPSDYIREVDMRAASPWLATWESARLLGAILYKDDIENRG